MSTAMSIFVIAGTLLSLLFFFLLLHLNRTISNPGETTGHNYDGIEEYDNPLPSWWYWWFISAILYAIAYLIYYPGLGNFEGVSGWTSVGQLVEEQEYAEATYGPLFEKYSAMSFDEIAETPAALKMGQRLYITNCSVCHGATGEGSFGFPNLTDSEWNWGGEPEDIIATLTHGRQGLMTPWGQVLGEEGVIDTTEYVLQLAGRDVDAEKAARGAGQFAIYCTACHGPEGKGNKLFGAPNLTNEIWLYGNSRLRIAHVIRNGRNGEMPAFGERLGADRIHIVGAYVKSLSKQ